MLAFILLSYSFFSNPSILALFVICCCLLSVYLTDCSVFQKLGGTGKYNKIKQTFLWQIFYGHVDQHFTDR